jgi:hypothetical protein
MKSNISEIISFNKILKSRNCRMLDFYNPYIFTNFSTMEQAPLLPDIFTKYTLVGKLDISIFSRLRILLDH